MNRSDAAAEDPVNALDEVLQSIHLAGSLFCRSVLSAPWGIAVDRADHASFHVVREGRCWVEVEGLGEPFELNAGDLMVLPRGHSHRLADSPSTPVRPLGQLLTSQPPSRTCPLTLGGDGQRTSLICGYFRFARGDIHPLLSMLPPLITVEGEGGQPRPWLAATLDSLARETETGGPGSETIITRLTDVLFIQVLRAYLEAVPEDSKSWLRGLKDPQIGRALGLIHGHPDRPWSIDGLALAVGMSRSTFSARFRRLVGEPPLQYLTRWRMHRAAEVLRAEDLSLAAVAAQVGYQAEAAFSKVFKRFVGTSPGTYRRRFHGSRRGEGPFVDAVV